MINQWMGHGLFRTNFQTSPHGSNPSDLRAKDLLKTAAGGLEFIEIASESSDEFWAFWINSSLIGGFKPTISKNLGRYWDQYGKEPRIWNHQADYNSCDERAGTRNSRDAFLLFLRPVWQLTESPCVPWGSARTISEENPKLVECLKIRNPYWHTVINFKDPRLFLGKPYVETHVQCNFLRAESTLPCPCGGLSGLIASD